MHWKRPVFFLEYFWERVYCLPKDKIHCRCQPRPFINRVKRLYSGRGEWIHTVLGPLRLRVLNPSHTPKEKYRRVVVQGKLTALANSVKSKSTEGTEIPSGGNTL